MKAKNFNKLTEAELERLAILAEECAEVQQIVMKIMRHGYESYNPNDETQTENRRLLEKELGDLNYITQLMCDENDIVFAQIKNFSYKKADKIKAYLHHQKPTS